MVRAMEASGRATGTLLGEFLRGRGRAAGGWGGGGVGGGGGAAQGGAPGLFWGVFLSGRRRAAGWTQRGLADAAGLSVGVVRDMEQGISGRPHPGSVERLAAALGVTLPVGSSV